MKKGIIWLALSCLITTSMVLASCSKTTSTVTSTSITSTSTSISTSTTTSTPKSTSTTVTTTTSAAAGNWWNSLGKPQYGGEMVLQMNRNPTSWDPYNASSTTTINCIFMERLLTNNWAEDPAVYKYVSLYRPNEYLEGLLAQSWEFSDPNTFVIHLRQGIHWQNIAPVNGREFTAYDVAYHWHRQFGGGDGFTQGNPLVTSIVQFQSLKSVTATDKYTVVFKWNTNPEIILENMETPNCLNNYEAPEAVQLWGDVNNWQHAIGTGPFILKDFVSGSSATFVKNPNYWGHDERYPQNQLPYVDSLKCLLISDYATALSAIRTGKLDVLDNVTTVDANNMQKTNSQVKQLTEPRAWGVTVDLRNDVAPFNNINVRTAMQMAIDLPTIASSYYGGGTDPSPVALTSEYLTGWGFPYAQWPQDLKDQYAYNPTAAKKLLADAGYPNGFKTDVVADASADLDLLLIVKSYFTAVNIDMDIRVMDHASWLTFVLANKKYDQIAMQSGGGMGVNYEPSRQFTGFMTGDPYNYYMVSDAVYDTFYPKALAATSIDGVKQALRDANEYIARHHFVISLLQPFVYALYQPWLKGFDGQFSSVSGGSGGPLFMGFYAARFWIDQPVKESMGH